MDLAGGSTSSRASDALFLFAGFLLALQLRVVLLDFKSLDYFASLKPWYNAIKGGGFSVFATGFSTYNPPYLYLLYLIARFLPDLPTEAAVKLPSLVSDFICAYLVCLIVKSQRPHSTTVPYLAALAVLFAPTVVLNSAFWGQADSIFTVGLLACVFFLGIRRPILAMLGFGFALAFKLQSIFLLPMLIAMTLRGRIPWKALLFIPLVLVLAILPSWLAGRPLGELIGVYAYQASQFEAITMNAPSVFALVPDSRRVFNMLYVPGVIFGAGVALLWFAVLVRTRRPIDGPLIAKVALVSMLAIPLFLPKMHERYFFPADVLAICIAFIEPAMFFVPIVVVGVSFFSYQPFLFERSYVPVQVLAVVLTSVTAYVTFRVAKELHVGQPGGSAAQHGQSVEALDSLPRSENPR